MKQFNFMLNIQEPTGKFINQKEIDITAEDLEKAIIEAWKESIQYMTTNYQYSLNLK